jgi:hypothetical protein
VLSVTSAGSLPEGTCALGASLSFAAAPLFGRCSLVTPGATWLTLFVDQYCGVAISPIKDTACAEPAASYWTDMRIAAHYVTPSLIATRFNPAATTPIRWGGLPALGQPGMCPGCVEMWGRPASKPAPSRCAAELPPMLTFLCAPLQLLHAVAGA